jgi:phosphotransferase system enzyme I (PtsI)
MSTTLTGRAASPGVAIAPAFVIEPRDDTDEDAETADLSAEEHKERADDALSKTEESLGEVADKMAEDAGEEEAAIFMAHADFAGDPEIAEMVHDAVDGGATAEQAVRDAFDKFRKMLEGSSSEYLAARATDIDDVRDQVLDVLAGREAAPAPTESSIIVADELTPSQTAKLPREFIAAIACEKGSPTSHAAILSRSLGIPAVVGCPGLLEAARASELMSIDGRTGEVLIDPDEEERRHVEKMIEREAEREERLAAMRDQPGQTKDGHRVELAANLNGPDAVESAVEHAAEGSGLVRTEFMFQEAQSEPTISEQVPFYKEALDALAGHRVVFRTMDVGADKPLPFVEREPEENPAMGLRGIRLGLARRSLLVHQLRALLRARDPEADQGRLAIMFPLVATAEEVRDARAALEEAAEAEDTTLDGVEVGIMIEVPIAALAARRLAPLVDFFSIGTNDLLQYLYAVDRMQAEIAELPDILDPAVLDLVGNVVAAAHDHDAWVGVCGETAADRTSAAAFVGLGIDELSMSPTGIGEIKAMLAEITFEQLQGLAAKARAAGTAQEVRDLYADLPMG